MFLGLPDPLARGTDPEADPRIRTVPKCHVLFLEELIYILPDPHYCFLGQLAYSLYISGVRLLILAKKTLESARVDQCEIVKKYIFVFFPPFLLPLDYVGDGHVVGKVGGTVELKRDFSNRRLSL